MTNKQLRNNKILLQLGVMGTTQLSLLTLGLAYIVFYAQSVAYSNVMRLIPLLVLSAISCFIFGILTATYQVQLDHMNRPVNYGIGRKIVDVIVVILINLLIVG